MAKWIWTWTQLWKKSEKPLKGGVCLESAKQVLKDVASLKLWLFFIVVQFQKPQIIVQAFKQHWSKNRFLKIKVRKQWSDGVFRLSLTEKTKQKFVIWDFFVNKQSFYFYAQIWQWYSWFNWLRKQCKQQ